MENTGTDTGESRPGGPGGTEQVWRSRRGGWGGGGGGLQVRSAEISPGVPISGQSGSGEAGEGPLLAPDSGNRASERRKWCRYFDNFGSIFSLKRPGPKASAVCR